MMNVNEIPSVMDVLPHRYPFLLIDRITHLAINEIDNPHATGIKNVTINEEFFQGHFPNHPIMPGVLTLEALAQVSGYIGLLMLGGEKNKMLYFAAADHVRFKRPVFPGDQLKLHAHLKSHRRGIWKFDCHASVDDEVVCTAEITCAEKQLESL